MTRARQSTKLMPSQQQPSHTESQGVPSQLPRKTGQYFKPVMSSMLQCSAVCAMLLASTLFTASPAQDVCMSMDRPNPIAEQYPDIVSGNLNGTTLIVPIPLSSAQSLVSDYAILEASYRSLLPSFPEGMYPMMVSAKHDHDLQLPAYNMTSVDFSVSSSIMRKQRAVI